MLFRSHPTGSVPQASGRRRTHTLWTLNALVMLSLAGFELGIVLMGQTHAGLSPQNISLMFAECSLVMLLINGVLFFTGWLQKAAGKSLLAGGSALAIAGLALLAQHPTDDWIYFGIALTSGGTGLVLPAISYLAAGTAQKRLGMTMGGLASAAGLGQTAGASLAGVLFGSATQLAFAWLTLPLLAVLMVALTCHLDSTGPEY